MSVLKTYGLETEDTFHPSLTYKIDGEHIRGKIDGLEAVKQAISLILSTERFEYPIYSTDYGAETKDLIGKGREYARGDLQRRVEEALAEDDRVTGISDFDISFSGETATATFTVNTEFGDVQEEVETTYGR
jgi:phage baseplate assembly protein W